MPGVDRIGKNVQLLIFKERQWDTILEAEDAGDSVDLTCRQMAKHAYLKDYLYFKEGQPYTIEFDRKIDNSD